MMRRKILKLSSMFLILILLPASSGVAVFHHICNVEGTHNVSLFTETKCDHQEDISGICEKCTEHKNDCSFDEISNCQEYVEYITIDADYITPLKLLIEPTEIILPFKEILLTFLESEKDSYCSQYFKEDIKKPVISNITFLIHKSQYKTSEKPSDNIIG